MNALLQRLYEQADDATLMMSMRNVHAMNLFSFVLKNDEGRLSRVFYTPSNVLEVNYPFSRTMSIGIHNHRYDLTLTGLQGRAVSYQYKVYDSIKGDDWALWHYTWHTYAGGHGRHARQGMVAVHLDSAWELSDRSNPLHLPASVPHTVWAEAGAAWLVEEGAIYREQTNLYSYEIGAMVPDMYTLFKNVKEVRRTFEGIFA